MQVQEHIPVIDELSFHGQFNADEIPNVLTRLKNVISKAKQHGFADSQKALICQELLSREIAPQKTLSQWLFAKVEKDPCRDIKAYFIRILGTRSFIDDLAIFSELEYLSGGQNSIGLGYAHHNSQPCFALPETGTDETTFRIVDLQKNSLDNDGSVAEEEVQAGVVIREDGFLGLRSAWVEALRGADTNTDVSGKTILELAWFCFPRLDFSPDAESDLMEMRPSDPTWKKVLQHFQIIDRSVYDFAHRQPGDTDSFLQILIKQCGGTSNASDENKDTKNDKRAAQDHCFFFPSLGKSLPCFLHTKYGDFKRIYFHHDESLHKAYIGKLNTHLIV